MAKAGEAHETTAIADVEAGAAQTKTKTSVRADCLDCVAGPFMSGPHATSIFLGVGATGCFGVALYLRQPYDVGLSAIVVVLCRLVYTLQSEHRALLGLSAGLVSSVGGKELTMKAHRSTRSAECADCFLGPFKSSSELMVVLIGIGGVACVSVALVLKHPFEATLAAIVTILCRLVYVLQSEHRALLEHCVGCSTLQWQRARSSGLPLTNDSLKRSAQLEEASTRSPTKDLGQDAVSVGPSSNNPTKGLDVAIAELKACEGAQGPLKTLVEEPTENVPVPTGSPSLLAPTQEKDDAEVVGTCARREMTAPAPLRSPQVSQSRESSPTKSSLRSPRCRQEERQKSPPRNQTQSSDARSNREDEKASMLQATSVLNNTAEQETALFGGASKTVGTGGVADQSPYRSAAPISPQNDPAPRGGGGFGLFGSSWN